MLYKTLHTDNPSRMKNKINRVGTYNSTNTNTHIMENFYKKLTTSARAFFSSNYF